MPRRRLNLDNPREYVRGGWPYGEVLEDAHPVVAYMQHIAITARRAITERRIAQSDLADQMDVDHSTLRFLLNGYRWPDIVTLVKLEEGLNVTLWPTRYVDARPMRDRIMLAMHDRLPDCQATHGHGRSLCKTLADAAVMSL